MAWPSVRAAALVSFALAACLENRAGHDDAAVPEHAGCSERLVDGTCVLAPDAGLTVFSAQSGLTFQDDRGVALPAHEEPVAGGMRVTVKPGARSALVLGVDPSGSVRHRLRIATSAEAPFLARAAEARRNGRPEEARRILTEARPESAADQARRTWLLARIALGADRTEDARSLLAQAVAEGERAGVASVSIDAATTLAYLEAHLLHEPARADAALSAVAHLAQLDPERRAEIAYNRALLARERGDLRETLVQLGELDGPVERLGLSALGDLALGLRAGTLSRLGRHDEALALRRTLVERGRDGSACTRADLQANAGWAALTALGAAQGDLTNTRANEAARDFAESLALANTCGERAPRQNALLNLGLLALLRGDLAEARARFTALDPDAASDPFIAPWLLHGSARIALAQGDHARAAEDFRRAYERTRAAADPEGEWRSLVGLGDALSRGGQPSDAARAYQQAEAVLERLVRAVPLGVGRGLFLDERGASSAGLIEALLAQGDPRAAHVAARQALAREEALAAARARPAEAVNPRVAALLVRHRAARDALARAARDDWQRSDADLRAVLAARADEIARADALLDEALAAASDGLSVHVEPPRAPGTLALTYAPRGRGYVALAESADAVEVARIDDADDEQALIAPFVAALRGATRVEIRAPRALEHVDFHALDVLGAPLVERAVVVYASDFGAEVEPRDDAHSVVVSDPTGELPGAAREGAYVAQALAGPVRGLSGSDALRDTVLAELERASLLHFAGHGRLATTGPLGQALTLADGALTLADVLALHTPPRVVVLSACHAGESAGANAPSFGLAQAFVARGARVVIAPSRAVDDEQSARFVRRLYDTARGERDWVAAFHATQRALSRERATIWKDYRIWTR